MGKNTKLAGVKYNKAKDRLEFEKPLKILTRITLLAILDIFPMNYGNMSTLTLRDNKGAIVGKLYILPNGTLADDSWTR